MKRDTRTKRRYAKIQIENMMVDAEKEMLGMLDKALNSGKLSDEVLEDNFLLAKAIIDIWCKKRPYEPLSEITQRENSKIAKLL